MKKYYPEYYDKFTCIADKCPDSCCKAWEIVIDDETYDRYLDVKAVIGDRIRKNIITDEDGDRCFKLSDGRCPFLNEKGLCDIHIELGEELTSKICRDHPRFIEEYDGFTEISLSLSCPEAVRIILSENPSDKLYPVPEYSGDDDVLELLIDSRKKLLSLEKDFFGCVAELLEKSANDEEEINQCFFDRGYMPSADSIRSYIKILHDKCEILAPMWKKTLTKALDSTESTDRLYSYIRNNDDIMKNILNYYIYRYYLKAVNDLDVYPRALFIAFSAFSSALISLSSDYPLEEAARLYSKEIEHSTDNADIILESLNEIPEV